MTRGNESPFLQHFRPRSHQFAVMIDRRPLVEPSVGPFIATPHIGVGNSRDPLKLDVDLVGPRVPPRVERDFHEREHDPRTREFGGDAPRFRPPG